MGNPIAKIGVRLHGVTLNLEADHPPLLDYAVTHLHGMVQPPYGTPDLSVKCWWSQREWDEEANPFPSNGGLNVIGKRMLGNAEALIWLDTLKMKGLQLRFRRANEQLHFEVAYCFHPKQKKLESAPEYEYKAYFSLMSYLVYYPMMWYLERTRSWTVLHASALATGESGVMIGGLGGVGKTTTCVALMQCDDMALMSENLIFTDGEFIYPCYEPIRLDEHSLTMLGAPPEKAGLMPMAFPEGLKDKWLFHVAQSELLERVRPAILFLPQFSSKSYLIELAPELAVEKILAMNRLTRELDDYGWYAAALDMHWPVANRAAQRVEVLREFVQRIVCFELGIDRSAGVGAVVENIRRVVNSPRRGI
ncbi:MAG: hypothetical protein ACREOO_31670 [bacterium]